MISFKEYFLEGKRYVVTMDFDHNLKFETGKPNQKIVEEFKQLQNEFDVYIVTSRMKTLGSQKEIEQFSEQFGLKPKGIIHIGSKNKADVILQLGSVKHYDDDEKQLNAIKQMNENIELVNTFDESAWKEYVQMMDDEEEI